MKRVVETLARLGFSVLPARHKNANGPDLFAIKNNIAYSVEVKVGRKMRRDSLQVTPVEKNRRLDDLIAIVTPSGYVLIEPMKHHMTCCSEKGYRNLLGFS